MNIDAQIKIMLAETMGLTLQKTALDFGEDWIPPMFDFNGKTIVVSAFLCETIEQATEQAADIVLEQLGKMIAERM